MSFEEPLVHWHAPFWLEDLTAEWESRNHRDEINAAILEGLDDITAGRVRSAEEVTDELECRLGLSK